MGPNHYTQVKIVEFKLRACQRIKEEFQKEKDNLEYQRDYYFVNKDAIKSRETGAFDRVTQKLTSS